MKAQPSSKKTEKKENKQIKQDKNKALSQMVEINPNVSTVTITITGLNALINKDFQKRLKG